VRLRFPETGADRAAPSADRDNGPATDTEVLGSWSATRWQYRGTAHHEQVVDVVAGLRGTVTISLSAGAFVLVWDVPGHGGGSSGGSLEITDGELTLRPGHGGDPQVVRYRVSARTLALSGESSAWDFDGRGEAPADFTAVLVRL